MKKNDISVKQKFFFLNNFQILLNYDDIKHWAMNLN